MLTQIFGGVSAIAGLLGAQSAAKRRQQEMQQLLGQMNAENEGNYLNELGDNSRQLYSAAGSGGDAIRALGSNLGAGLAAGGVYNSSAVGGALAQGQRDVGSNLAQMAARLQTGALQRRQAGRNQVRGLQYNLVDQSANDARSDLSTARGGLQSFLGGIVQQNLMRSGANAGRTSIPPIVNGTVNQGANLPGNAGLGNWRSLLDLSKPRY